MWIACYYLPDFSIACERALHPHLESMPLGLRGEDGTLCAISPEAASAGVRIGQTPAAARIFCPDLQVLPYNRESYLRMAEPVWDRIACDSSCVEPVSPELCFAVLSGAGIRARVLQIGEDVERITGIRVQMSLSVSRLAAREAAIRKAADTLVVVPEGCEASVLADVPVEQLPHISREDRERFHRLGIRVVGDLIALPEEELYRVFRERSVLFRRLAAGKDHDPVRPLWPPDCEEHTLELECGIVEEAMLHEALRQCAARISEHLLRRGRRCRSVTLVLRSETGRAWVRTERLQAPENRLEALQRTALRLLERMVPFPEEPPVSVNLRAVIAEQTTSVQLALLDERTPSRGSFHEERRGRRAPHKDVCAPLTSPNTSLSHERRRRLDAAVDLLRERLGGQPVVHAARLQTAQPFRLWTYPLGRRVNERIEVRTDASGDPRSYRWHGRWRKITAVQNRWAEAGWGEGRLEEGMVFRVETSALTLAEIRRCGGEWRLTALAD